MSDDLSKKFADIASAEIRKEIDWEIISNLLINSGWTKVRIQGKTSSDTEKVMSDWCKKSVVGKFMHMPHEFIFELEKDATLFILRWVNGEN